MTKANETSDVRKLGALIKDIKIAMLATVDPDGSVRSRPMIAQDFDFDGDLWFFTGRSTGKVQSIEAHPNVNLSFASPKDSRFISVFGRAAIVDDRAKEASLWNPLYEAWFPQGLEDPDLVLLKVHVEGAEYWDTPSSKVVQLLGFAKALATGERYQPGPGEHAKIELPN